MVNYKKYETTNKDIKCIIEMDGVGHETDDFVAILSKENGDASIFYNTDALTLGMAVKMVARAFVECMHECSEEEQAEITAILGTAFIGDKPEEVPHA